jgi:hypothetical protein
MKGSDALAGGRGKTEMQPGLRVGPHRALAEADPELNRILAISERRIARAEARIAERLEGGVIKGFRFGDIANADRNVIDHLIVSILVARGIPRRIGGAALKNPMPPCPFHRLGKIAMFGS